MAQLSRPDRRRRPLVTWLRVLCFVIARRILQRYDRPAPSTPVRVVPVSIIVTCTRCRVPIRTRREDALSYTVRNGRPFHFCPRCWPAGDRSLATFLRVLRACELAEHAEAN